MVAMADPPSGKFSFRNTADRADESRGISALPSVEIRFYQLYRGGLSTMKIAKDTKGLDNLNSKLRALRVLLSGENGPFVFGCDTAVLGFPAGTRLFFRGAGESVLVFQTPHQLFIGIFGDHAAKLGTIVVDEADVFGDDVVNLPFV